MATAKERFIPAKSVAKTRKGIDAIVYLYTSAKGRPGAIGYIGKSSKHDFYYSFPDKVERDNFLKGWWSNVIEKDKEKKKAAAKAAAFTHGLKVGDVLYTTWGYDQTNIDWWEVVAVPSGKTVKVRELHAHVVETGFMTGPSTPVIGSYKNDGIRIVKPRPSYCNDGCRIKIDFGHGGKWDGKPMTCSWYA